MSRILSLFLLISISFHGIAQLPERVFAGYWQINWGESIPLTEIDDRYNVINIAFATGINDGDWPYYRLEFQTPQDYTVNSFIADVQALQQRGKIVNLSIGGANDPIRLDNVTERNAFVQSIKAIFETYNYVFDGIDIDIETSSFNVGWWTMDNPAAAQNNFVDAIKSIMTDYQNEVGKKMILTAAPEVVYVVGGKSQWQVNNVNAGAFLPILEGLRDDLDLVHMQYYNAGGAWGGLIATDDVIYYDTGDPDFITAFTEMFIQGYTLVGGKGSFSGFPASKVAIGLPANACAAATTGFVAPTDIKPACDYLMGSINRPNNGQFSYILQSSYPELRGLMTWSIQEDKLSCSGVYAMATAFEDIFGTLLITSNDALVDISNEIVTYPNPTNDGLFHLETNLADPSFLRISNLQGLMVHEVPLMSRSTEVDLTGLSKGIYVGEIESANSIGAFQIIID